MFKIFICKKEAVKGKIPSGYDDIKDYVIQARTNDPLKRAYQLGNILIEYTTLFSIRTPH